MSKKHTKSLALGALMAFLITGNAFAAGLSTNNGAENAPSVSTPVFGTPGVVLGSEPLVIDGNKTIKSLNGYAISGYGSMEVSGNLVAESVVNNALTVGSATDIFKPSTGAYIGAENVTLKADQSFSAGVANGNAILAYGNVTVEAKNDLNLTANNRIIRALDGAAVNLNAANVNMNAELVDDAAIKVTDSAKLAINAAEGVVLNAEGAGSLFTGIKAESANVEVFGKNIDINVVNAEGEVRGVNAREGSVIKLGNEATETVRVAVEGQKGYGILAQYRDSEVVVEGSALEIAGNGNVTGILAMNSSANKASGVEVDPAHMATVVVGENTVTNIKITDENGNLAGTGIGAMSEGIVDIKGDLYVNAEKAIIARGDAVVNVNTEGKDKIVQLTGDIAFDYDGETSGTPVNAAVDVRLTNSDSFINGNVGVVTGENFPEGYDEINEMKLELSNGATWYTDGESLVNKLKVNDANIVIENAHEGSITVNTLTGSGMNVELASGEAEAGIIKVDGMLLDAETANGFNVSVGTTGVTMNTKSANEQYKKIVQVGTGDDAVGIVTEINAKDTFISGDVVFKADENGELKVAETTLNGDVNVNGKLTAEDVVIGDVSITDKFAEAKQQVVDKFAEVQEQLGQAEEYVAGKFDAVDEKFAQVDSTLADHEGRIETLEGTVEDHEGRIGSLETTVGALNGAVDQEVADRIAADAALKQEVTDAYKAADAKLQEGIDLNTRANDVQSQQISGLQSKDLAHDKAIADNKAAIEAEADAREAADKVLQDNIDAEAKARQDADAAEAKARQDADAKLKEAMTSEVGRLDNRLDKVDAKIDKVGAMAAAMASLKTMGYDPEAPTEIAVGVGQYRNETGIAIGAFHYPNKNFMLNFSLSTAGDEVMGGIGATWKIGRKR